MILHYQTYEKLEEALNNRLQTLVQLYHNSERGELQFPSKLMMLGFPQLEIKNKEDLIGRIRELCDCLGVDKFSLSVNINNTIIEYNFD